MLTNRSTSVALLFTISIFLMILTVSSRLQIMSDANAGIENSSSCKVDTEMASSTTNTQALDPDNIAFLNWNLYKGNGKNWQKDLSVFAKSHDIMTIQEALLNEELTVLLQTHGFDWEMHTAFHLDGIATGVMTVANSQAIHRCGYRMKEPLIRIPKSTLISYYDIENHTEKLLVANIHSINFTLGVNTYRRQLTRLYNAIQHHDGPMIVAGDFNSWSSSRLAELNTFVNQLSLTDIKYPVNNKTHVFGNAIDHVFYRQLELKNNQVWQVSSSDHNPISVNFRVIREPII